MEVRNAYEILVTKDSPTEYLIDGLLPVELTIFTGREKIGKSFFLLQLAGSICSGKNFLDKSVNKGEVLYLALEDTEGRLNHRMRKQKSFFENLDFITKMEEGESLEEILHEYMNKNPKCRCIIVDHFLLAEAGAITSEYDHDLQVARKYKSLADQYKLSLILVIHEKKGKANSQIEKVIGRGLSATADCILRLSRNDNTTIATLYSAGRDITEKNIVIEFKFKDKQTKMLKIILIILLILIELYKKGQYLGLLTLVMLQVVLMNIVKERGMNDENC